MPGKSPTIPFAQLAVALVSIALLSACRTPERGGNGGMSTGEPTTFPTAAGGLAALAGDWELIELDGASLATMLPHNYGGRRPMLTIRPDGAVRGFSGVNSLGARLDGDALTSGRFALGPVAMTLMAGSPELMRIESRLGIAISEPRAFLLRGEVLTLWDAHRQAEPVARFRRTAPAAPDRNPA